MSKHLRDDKECQNCGYTVDRNFCSECGQKNTYTRQPFLHLFAHFVEDLTHYDNAFWKTIKHLLFRPARLTREYLQGRRITYVPPVKLYIFISFVTFFLISILPSEDDEEKSFVKRDEHVVKENDSVRTITTKETFKVVNGRKFGSVKELEDFQENAAESDKISFIEYWTAKADLNVQEHEVTDKAMGEKIIQVLSKILFLYMPVFAFWLWLLHGKKRWFFFDHGIFTLHYFSFLLLLLAIYIILMEAIDFFVASDGTTSAIAGILAIFPAVYSFFYFFRSHRRMYGEKRWISRTKSFVLFWINMICFSCALIAGMVYALVSIH